jgi:steroid delta-isomerase-like uncharacterized protein
MTMNAQALTARQAAAVSFHQAFHDGDLTLLDRLLADDWVNHPRNPSEAPGREGFKGTVQWFRSVFPDIAFRVEDVLEDGDEVTIRSIARGTHRAEFLGLAPTGKTVEFIALEIHRFRGEQIVESWHLQDYYAMLAQLGLIDDVMGAGVTPYAGWA